VAAFAALVVYAWRQYWTFATDATRWLLGGLAAAILASGILAGITAAHLGIIDLTVTPYALVHSPKNLLLGAWYAVLGILTNFGANPGHAAQTLAAFPHEAGHNLFSGAGFGYLINVCLFIAIAGLSVRFAYNHIRHKSFQGDRSDAARLAIGLLWTAIASLPLFIMSDHQYVVDARYLTIWLFALLIAGSIQLRKIELPRKAYPAIALVLFSSVLSGLWYSVHTYNASATALSDTTERNVKIASITQREQIDFLIGDYWRVLPIRQVSKVPLTVVPMQTCDQARTTLTSRQWEKARQHGKFAYLLTIDGSLTDFPNCTFAAIENIYGTPESSTLVAGTIEKPKELLLIYGSNHTMPRQQRSASNAPTITTLVALPNAACSGPTIVNVVAHEDDDLLFINPDTARAIQQGFCVRTVYLTAGDAGIGRMYWLAREHGSREAYSRMIGKADSWNLQEISANSRESITVATPLDNPRVSLVFFRLPDGNLHGEGFGQNGGESLSGLYARNFESLQSVDGQSAYSGASLTNMLAGLLNAYQPTLVRTQSSTYSNSYEDHSDHQITGKFTTDAFNLYVKQTRQKSKIAYYIGYPVRDRKINLSKADIAEKSAAFLAYAKYDPSVCTSVAICYQTPTYNAYLHRQYQASK
jgi:LmbE family N-acetylglucosaminyl deacetylase